MCVWTDINREFLQVFDCWFKFSFTLVFCALERCAELWLVHVKAHSKRVCVCGTLSPLNPAKVNADRMKLVLIGSIVPCHRLSHNRHQYTQKFAGIWRLTASLVNQTGPGICQLDHVIQQVMFSTGSPLPSKLSEGTNQISCAACKACIRLPRSPRAPARPCPCSFPFPGPTACPAF